MLNTFPNSIWIESYGRITVIVRCFPELRFFHDIWWSNRWISMIFIPLWSLAFWLQFICWPLREITSGSGVMNFQSRIALKSGLLCFLAAARVYAVLPHRTSRLLFIPVDYSRMIQSTILISSRLLDLIASCAILSAFNLSTWSICSAGTCRHDLSSRLVPNPVDWIARCVLLLRARCFPHAAAWCCCWAASWACCGRTAGHGNAWFLPFLQLWSIFLHFVWFLHDFHHS